MRSSPPIHLRPAVEQDHAFIYATYLRHKWYAKDNETTLRKDTWMRVQHDRLERLLESQVVLVACLPDDHDIVLGYRFMDGSRPFEYVKRAFRDQGVEEALRSEE